MARPDSRPPYRETFLISLAVILLEINYTRVFSFKLVYYFTYLVIGIALLGLGAGAVFVSVGERLRRVPLDRFLAVCGITGAVAVLVGYLIIAWTPLNLFAMVLLSSQGSLAPALREAAKLAGVILVLFVPFLSAGLSLARIFSSDPDRFSRLYSVDLLGAALGCAIAIPVLSTIGPPGGVFLAGFCLALAAIAPATRISPRLVAGAGVAGFCLLAGVAFPTRLPDPVLDSIKQGPKPVKPEFTAWSPVFRVDVLPPTFSKPPVRFLMHDGQLGSSMLRFGGDVASLDRYDASDRAYPFRLLGPEPRVAIIGSAGGNEILASLWFGAGHVTAIELNPATVSLLRNEFADFTGRIAEHPKVELFNAEGRSFLRSSDRRFDLIWLVAPDSYAAMNAATSGAFVLSESYLYTKEMILDALEHLEEDGILAAQFGEGQFDTKPNRTLRYLATAREAFRELGEDDFREHVLVALSPGLERTKNVTILLRKAPFTDADRERLAAAVAGVADASTVYPDAAQESPLLKTIVEGTQEEVEARLRDYPFRVDPIDDDAPFFWNFVRFSDLLPGARAARHFTIEEGVGERLLLVFLCFSALFAAVFLLAPIALRRELWRAVPYKLRAGIYFAALGLGFMFLEVGLIQKLTLFLGYPTYSLTVTLLALLVSTGLGSLAAERYSPSLRTLVGLAIVLAVLVAFYQVGLSSFIRNAVGWPLALRIACTVVVLAPLGLCLGSFMPLGIRVAAASTVHREEFVAWCWAVNGFFSVSSSVLATLLSMSFGFDRLMAIGLCVYLIGIASLALVPVVRGGSAAAEELRVG